MASHVTGLWLHPHAARTVFASENSVEFDDCPIHLFMTRAPEDRTLLEAYFDCISFALLQGDHTLSRPPLPIEIILLIAAHLPLIEKFKSRVENSTASSHGEQAEAVLNVVPVIEGVPAKLVFRTRSSDQGWVSDPESGSWSWFEIRVCKENGENITFTSHHNRLAETEFFLHTVVFDQNHEVWSQIQAGDWIETVACALFPGWQNKVDYAEVSLSTPYTPDLRWLESTVGETEGAKPRMQNHGINLKCLVL
jgi:hypothetical protein